MTENEINTTAKIKSDERLIDARFQSLETGKKAYGALEAPPGPSKVENDEQSLKTLHEQLQEMLNTPPAATSPFF